MKDQTRNLNPTPEAIFAMYNWSYTYSQQRGGSMDFYDTLSDRNKKFCQEAVKKIRS